MNTSTIRVKHMVCPRCVQAVRKIFEDCHIKIVSIALGEVVVEHSPSSEQLRELHDRLDTAGFELLQDSASKMISQVKAVVIKHIHHANAAPSRQFSSIIAESLHRDYSTISRLFSSVEGMTIEKFIIRQKIEKVKELLSYEEDSLTEIGYKLGYSSVAHLSAQFKKETGMTPTQFRADSPSQRRSLDEI